MTDFNMLKYQMRKWLQRERVINDDGKLVEQVVAEGTGTKDYASVLTNMVSQLAMV